jgi:hypothetical protein
MRVQKHRAAELTKRELSKITEVANSEYSMADSLRMQESFRLSGVKGFSDGSRNKPIE